MSDPLDDALKAMRAKHAVTVASPIPSPATAVDTGDPLDAALDAFRKRQKTDLQKATEAVPSQQKAAESAVLLGLPVNAPPPEERHSPASFGEFMQKWDPWGRYKEIWTNPDHPWWSKALGGTLGAPLHLVASGITTELGLPASESLSRPILEYARSRGDQNFLSAMGWRALGLGADIAADPLTYATLGAGPMFKAAAKYLKGANEVEALSDTALKAGSVAPKSGLLSPEVDKPLADASRLGTATDIKPATRAGASMSKDFIEGHVAPEYTRDHIKATLGDLAHGTPEHTALTEVLRASENLGSDAYKKAVEGYRAQRLPYMEKVEPLPSSIHHPDILDLVKGPAAKAQALDDLAKHEARTAQNIWDQRPMTRLFGQNPARLFGQAAADKFALPGLDIGMKLGQAAGELTRQPWMPQVVKDWGSTGKWVTHDAAQPIADMPITAKTPEEAHKQWLDPAEVAKWEQQPGYKNAYHTAHPDLKTYALTEAIPKYIEPILEGGVVPQKLTGPELEKLVLRAQVGSTRVGQIITQTKPIGRARISPLENWVTRDVSDLNAADKVERFDHIRAIYRLLHEIKKADPLKRTSYTLAEMGTAVQDLDRMAGDNAFWERAFGKEGPRTYDFVLQRIEKTNQWWQDRLAATNTIMADAVASGDPDKIVEATAHILATGTALAESRIGSQFRLQDQWAAAGLPYRIGAATRDMGVVHGETAKRVMLDTHDGLDKFLHMTANGWQEPMSGLLYLAHAPKAEIEAAVARIRSTRAANAAAGVPMSNADLNGIKATLTNGLDKLAKAGKIADPRVVVETKTFIRNLTADGLGHLAEVLHEISKSKKMSEMHAQLTAHLAEPLSNLMTKVDAALHGFHGAELRMLNDLFGHWQATFEPTLLAQSRGFKWMLQRYDAIRDSALSYAGIKPAVLETYRRNEDLEVRAGDMAMTDNVAFQKAMRSHLPAGHTIGDFKDAMEGFYELKDSADTIAKYGSAKVSELSLIEQEIKTDALAIAQKNAAEGRAKMDRVFGSTANADAAMVKIMADVRKHTDAKWAKERASGAILQYRKDYLPHAIKGRWHDTDEFWKWVESKEVAQMVKQETTASHFHSSALQRQWQTAEVEALLDKYKQYTVNGGGHLFPPPMKVSHNLAEVIGHRDFLHYRTMANRRYIAELQQVLPAHVMPVMNANPKTNPALVRHLQSTGFQDLGEIIRPLRGWWVRKPLYDFLSKHSAGNLSNLESENFLVDWVMKSQWYLKRLNTTMTPFHAKNILMNALIVGPWWTNAAAITKHVFKNPEELAARSRAERWLSPLQAYKHSLESWHSYKEADGVNLFAFKGQEATRPIMDRIETSMQAPATSGKWAANRALQAAKGVGPFDTALFDISDRILKLSTYDKFRAMGLSPRDAADAVNHFMIDYSMKWLNPEWKRKGYGWFPFFAWHAGNAMLHIPNMMENPVKYALLDHARRFSNEQYAGTPEEAPRSQQLAEAWATQWADPRSGMNTWILPETPWEKFALLEKKILNEHRASNVMDAASFLSNRLWALNPVHMGVQYLNPSTRHLLDKYGGWGFLFGTPTRTGELESSFAFGLHPYTSFMKVFLDPTEWSHLPEEVKLDLVREFIRAEPVEYGRHGLKVHRE